MSDVRWRAGAVAGGSLTAAGVLLLVLVPASGSRPAEPVPIADIMRVLPICAAPVAGVLAAFRRRLRAPAAPIGAATGAHVFGAGLAALIVLHAVLAATVFAGISPSIGLAIAGYCALLFGVFLHAQKPRLVVGGAAAEPRSTAMLRLTPGGAEVTVLLVFGALGVAFLSGGSRSALILAMAIACVGVYATYGGVIAQLLDHRRPAAFLACLVALMGLTAAILRPPTDYALPVATGLLLATGLVWAALEQSRRAILQHLRLDATDGN